MEADQLPPPHPRFAAHFTSQVYDPGRADNDDALPFGTDEGFDTDHEWAGRLDVMQADPRLDVVIGSDVEDLARDALHDDPDVLDQLVSATFTLLRYTGSLNATGKALVLTVLSHWADQDAGDSYDRLLADLVAFPDADEQQVTKKPRRGSSPWLVLDGGRNDPLHKKWLRQHAAAVMADPDWRQWWSHEPPTCSESSSCRCCRPPAAS